MTNTTPRLPEAAQEVVDRYRMAIPAWPDGDFAGAESADLADRCRGSLVWGATGDALGRPTEAKSWDLIRRLWSPDGVTEFQPWHGWQSGPIGTWTDDTQLTIEVAKTILESDGHVDPRLLSEKRRAWLPHGRGKGRATTSAILAMDAGAPWWEAGPSVASAGNGAAMRAAPVGLAWSMAPDGGHS